MLRLPIKAVTMQFLMRTTLSICKLDELCCAISDSNQILCLSIILAITPLDS
jgi:hypothetical protein